MILAELEQRDWDELFRGWSVAVACPRWRLVAESPSPGLFHHLVASAAVQRVVRDEGGRPCGLLQVYNVDGDNGYGFLGYLLVDPGRCGPVVADFLHEALRASGLRKVVVSVEGDALDAFAGLLPRMRVAGRLVEHTLGGDGRYVDRHVFEVFGSDGGEGRVGPGPVPSV